MQVSIHVRMEKRMTIESEKAQPLDCNIGIVSVH